MILSIPFEIVESKLVSSQAVVRDTTFEELICIQSSQPLGSHQKVYGGIILEEFACDYSSKCPIQ